uniref:Pectinesterase inhibitor domain-containing protein n=1 Tax=Oryza glumipatula TaxID=40148 RepID=A0A0E0AYC7_9ORYZ
MARPAAAVTTLLAVVVLVSVAASLPAAVVGDARFVARTCKRTNHTECVKMLSADRRSARATTVRQLAGIAVDIAAATVKSSAAAVYGKFLENHGQALELTLLECWWMYDLAAGEAQAAVDAYSSGGRGAYLDVVRHQLTGYYAGIMCDNMIVRRASVSPVADIDRTTATHCNIAVDLIGLLY